MADLNKPMRETEAALVLRRIRLLTALFIAGLVLSGATAIPLESELNWLVKATGAKAKVETRTGTHAPSWAAWLVKVQLALEETNARYPFMSYGADWLAFGHFAIAVAFIGAWRDPVRNRWLFDFGLIVCALVVPYAMVFGGVRGIPWGWRLVDCLFGVFGAVPLWWCQRWTRVLEEVRRTNHQASQSPP